MHILMVEDDDQQSDHYLPALREAFPEITFSLIRTASEFVEAIAKHQSNPPVFIIMDVMLPWAMPDPNNQAPPADFDFRRAGIFLLELLRANRAYDNVPVMVWSAVHHHLRDFSTRAINKSEFPTDALINQIRSLLLANGHVLKASKTGKSKVSKFAKHIEIKPSFFGISFNAKEALNMLFQRTGKR